MQAVVSPPRADIARARQAVYGFLQSALGRPTPEQHAWMRGESFRGLLEDVAETFGIFCPAGELVPEQFADHESRYLACFEVGFPEPPVVLLASHHHRNEPAPRLIHEHILLYRLFGVQVSSANLEPADHLISQLAFLCWLDDPLLAGTLEAESVQRARRDFLARHFRWPGQAADQAEQKHLPPVYCALLRLLACAAEQDLELCSRE